MTMTTPNWAIACHTKANTSLHMAYPTTKFGVSSFSLSTDISWDQGSHDPGHANLCVSCHLEANNIHSPLAGMVCHQQLELLMVNLCPKVSNFTYYEDMNGSAKCTKWGS